MIIYKNSAIGFRHAVDSNSIVSDIENEYTAKLGRRVNANEKRAWNNSLRFMETIIRKSQVADDCGIMIEYNIPTTSKRVDFIISGLDENYRENFVIIELKQWEKITATQKDALVITYVGGSQREVLHPSYQAFSYKQYITDMNEAVYSNNLFAHSCAYLHNYNMKNPEPLLSSQYTDLVISSPIFLSEDTELLQNYLYKYVGKGKGLDILYTIENGRIRPSKKLIEYVSDIFEDNPAYILIDEQKIAYENILFYANATSQKRTIIINGEPGTGKSVVAMNAFVSLLKNNNNIRFVAPNSSFRTALIEQLSNNTKTSKKRLSILFSGSSKFFNEVPNLFDILIIDEAHRLKNHKAFMYSGENQIEDIIKASQINVFFIDDNQRIRPEDIGSIQEIKRVANKYDSEVIEIQLATQFRCSGAEGFLNWIDHNFQIKDTANFDGWDKESFDFEIIDTPNKLFEIIKERNQQGFNARLLAGYAWEWTQAKDGNSSGEINDVKIEEHRFQMPWNGRDISTTWALEPSGINQVGCVHTSQGLEFDYVGVIIGNDLQYDPESMELFASYENYYDKSGKKGLKHDPKSLTQLVKNIYKILLSRGMKGCYIFCRDKNLQLYLKSRLLNMNS